jgi:hypothetical protein
MHALRTRIFFLGSIAAFAIGCDAQAPTPPPLPTAEVYHQPTAPDSVVANLILAHHRRDREAYVGLLAPEFRFFFVASDANILGAPYWTRSQDTTGTAALFSAASHIDLTAARSVPEAVDESRFPPGTQKIHLHTVELRVTQPDRITWVVNTDQDLYLRPGNTSLGEDPTHWFLLQWNELNPVDGPRPGEPTPVRASTWGRMKSMYL